ncbi:heavy-metal-associated domain-containing protein [Tsukamurella sp. 1534]|uniref:heavy-metal-associated domain-containing protein n=1 Tax=Tsukamurella sp. 1534 TaxID=1151061 RepID=UPI0002DE8C3C|nr:heavy-metal-associated domain-containing protein [Tsukamurella sp. 1534]
MNAGGRLALYGAGVVVAFGAAFGLAGAVVPDSVVAGWTERSGEMESHGAHGGPEATATSAGLKGLSLSAEGMVLTSVAAPAAVGEQGTLSFRIETTAGAPVTRFARTHEKDMHLMVVRSDGAAFRHVHPTLDAATGTWSLPWSWAEPGTYRVYADFAAQDGAAATLTRTVEVAGGFTPVDPAPSRVSTVDGYTVTLDGDLAAGATRPLTLSVARDGAPVRDLQPYLGAFGHLVALRQGDLAFLHVHPEGTEPKAGDLGGPAISFQAAAPTAGRYLLYLDFQVGGTVRTASFVVDAQPGAARDGARNDGAQPSPQQTTIPAQPQDGGHGGDTHDETGH